MQWAMGTLAGSCLGFALLAPWIVSLLGRVSGTLIGAGTPVPSFTFNGLFIALAGIGQIFPSVLGWMLSGIILVLFAVLAIFANRKVKPAPSWACGLPGLTPRMQYTATGYSKPLRRIFSFLYQPTRQVELEDEGHEILRTAQRFESKTTHVFDEWIYKPLGKCMVFVSKKAKLIQTGHIQLYLSYIFITLIVLLVYWSRL
jgi:hydrogenase-4 component B